MSIQSTGLSDGERTVTYSRTNDVAARYKIHARTVPDWVKQGRLPKPIYKGRFPLWANHELDEMDRQASRDRRPAA